MDQRIIVIGAGQAGASMVAKLRDLGHTGSLTLIGAEVAPPYQRPPLSKKYLLGDMALERLYLRPEHYYADQNITLRTHTRVARINRDTREVVLEDGQALPYDLLAITTGSIPNRLPAAVGGALGGVYVMRDLADADSIAPEFATGRRALIIGGGYIGLEAAAVAAARGVQVTLVEMADRILARVGSPATADYFRALHASHGVDIREGVGLTRLTGEGRVTGAELSDGSTLDVDFALAGVGIRPDTTLAEDAGLMIDNGIKVDGMGRTSDPTIYAAGDCTSFPYRGGRIRLESVPNAIDQAEVAAAAMLGHPIAYEAKPWFWSDQYDVKLQIAGLNTGYDRTVTRPGTRDGAQSVWYYRGETLLAVDAMNEPRSYMAGKRMIEAGTSPQPEAVADPTTDLKVLMQSGS